jgi:hypothetical protein
MKTQHLIFMGTAVALLAGIGVSSPTQAFDVTNQPLGVSSVATDIIQFTCPAGTTSARGSIRDIAPVAAPLVRLGLFKPPGLMTVVEAPPEGLSPVAIRASGPGTYWAVINKTGPIRERYNVTINCHNAAGGILPAAGISLTQNQ